MKKAFAANGYDENFAKVTLSNRPDLCEYQCNGAMAAAKTYKKKPIDIANGVVGQLKDSEVFEEASHYGRQHDVFADSVSYLVTSP